MTREATPAKSSPGIHCSSVNLPLRSRRFRSIFASRRCSVFCRAGRKSIDRQTQRLYSRLKYREQHRLPKTRRHPQTPRDIEERHYLDLRRGILIQRVVRLDEQGRVSRYSLAYMDPTISLADNGRVLGYDNHHGYHHRHFMGEVQAVEFLTYEQIEARFDAEFRALYDTHHPRKAGR